MNQITLYYREGSSDKVYQVSLEPGGNQFVVNFAFGRRGSTLQTGTKTQSPVDYETASRIFTRLVNEKKAKGYTPGEQGTPYQDSEKAGQVAGIQPQLLNPIDEAEASRMVRDPAWCLQEKKDGRRLLLRKQGQTITGINRKGLVIGLPAAIVKSAENIEEDFLLDGECVGDQLYAFDLLSRGENTLLPQPYQVRLNELIDLLDYSDHPQIELIETAFEAAEKQSFIETLRRDQREGVVFKRLDAPYTPGRPSQGGSQLKYKLRHPVSRGRQSKPTTKCRASPAQRRGLAKRWQRHDPAQPGGSQGGRGGGSALSLGLPGERLPLPAGLSGRAR